MKLHVSCVIVVKLSKGREADLKRTIAAGLVMIMLVFMVTASASPAGSITDPLISRSYLEGTYATSLHFDIRNKLGGALSDAMGKLDEIYRSHVGYSFAPGFTRVSLSQGSAISLSAGSSFILFSGSASLAITSGVVINVATGNEAVAGSRLTPYQRYFCTENTSARITASSALTGQVDGYYLLVGGTAPPTSLPFIDVAAGAWYFSAVEFVYKNELFTGVSANTFAPTTPMTRAMFVTVLHRLDGRPPAGDGGGFSDVSNISLYYYDAVAWANGNEIVTGYADGTFQPDRYVTREQMAAIMHRYAIYKERDISVTGNVYDTFPDKGRVSVYAVAAMRWAVSKEIIRGSNGNLLPQNTATRAEVAQIIYNYCEEVGQ